MEPPPILPADISLLDCAGHVAKSIRDPFRKSFVFTKLAEAYGRHSRNDKATEVLTEAIDIAKVLEEGGRITIGLLYKIALVAASLGNYQQARAVATAMDPHYETLAAFDIAMLPEQRKYDDAIEAAGRMKSAGMVSQLAGVSAEVRRNPKLEEILALAYASSPPDMLFVAQHNIRKLAEIAEAYIRLEQPEKAAAMINESLQLVPALKDNVSKAEALVDIADEYAKLGQSKQAATILNEALQFANACDGSLGDKASVLGRIAMMFARVGHYEPAYNVALTLGNAGLVVEEKAGSYAHVVAETALLLAKGGRADMADSLASLAISLHAFDRRCLYDHILARCAELYTTLGRPDKALQVLSLFKPGRRTDAFGIDLGINAVLEIADGYERIGRRDLADDLLVRSRNVDQLTQHIQKHSCSLWITGELMATLDEALMWPKTSTQDHLTCYRQQITTLLKRTVAAERATGRPPPDALDRVLSAVEATDDESCRAETLSLVASLFAADGQKAKAVDILVRSLAAAKAIKDTPNAPDPAFSVATTLLTIDEHCVAAGIEVDDRAQQILREIA